MTVERTPKPGSNMSIVLGFLQSGGTRQEAANLPGFSRSKVAYTIANLRREGYYDQNLGERVREWREAVSLGRGGIWPLVREYAQMQMSPAEIREAVFLKQNRKLTPQQVNTVLPKARKRGDLPERTWEEKLDISKDAKRPNEDIEARVELWLQVKQILDDNNLTDIPQGRADWTSLARYLYEKRLALFGKEPTRSLFNDVFNSSSMGEHLEPCLRAIRTKTPDAINIKSKEEGFVLRDGQGKPIKDSDGLLAIEFLGPHHYSRYVLRVPEDLIGESYRIIEDC